MRDYLNKTVINTFLEIKKLIDNIISDNVVFSIKKNEYIICVNLLYGILADTLKKIEDVYYNYILLPKLQNYNKSSQEFNTKDVSLKNYEPPIISDVPKNKIYKIVLTTIVYSIIK